MRQNIKDFQHVTTTGIDVNPLAPEFFDTVGALDATKTQSVRIPELRNIRIDDKLRALMDHPAFQRLRKIRQLGTTHLVYPGATHTRFEHSLGVLGCTQWFIQSLLRHPNARVSFAEADILALLAAAMLHDLGHYPFAHSLEALHLKGRDTPRHEDLGGRIMRGEFEGLQGPKTIADILQGEWGIDSDRVISLCTGDLGESPSKVDQILRSILSGAIDSDKMDYLERDAHHMGVPYGRHYDRQRLLASLTLNESETGIALNAKGKVSAEMFIFSRYTMFSEAYWHHTVRATCAMVEGALAAFYSRTTLGPEDLLEVLLSHDDDKFLEWLYQQSPDGSATRYLLEGMVGYRRSLYKRVMTFSQVYMEEEKKLAYETLYHMPAAQLYSLTDELRLGLATLLGRPLHPAALIFDTPPRDKDKLDSIEIFFPSAQGKQYYALEDLSRVVAGVGRDFIRVVKKIRLFAHPSLAQAILEEPKANDLMMKIILARS